MKQAFDQNSIRLTLQKAIQAGHFTLDDLDAPSPGFRECTKVDRRTFPGGYEGVQFRNLLRDTEVTHPGGCGHTARPQGFHGRFASTECAYATG